MKYKPKSEAVLLCKMSAQSVSGSGGSPEPYSSTALRSWCPLALGTSGSRGIHWSLWARASTWTTWTGGFLTPQCRNSTTRWLCVWLCVQHSQRDSFSWRSQLVSFSWRRSLWQSRDFRFEAIISKLCPDGHNNTYNTLLSAVLLFHVYTVWFYRGI